MPEVNIRYYNLGRLFLRVISKQLKKSVCVKAINSHHN